MVDLHSPTAPTIARKEAARTAKKAYGKRKTRQVAATRVVRASKAEKNDPQDELQGEPPAKKKGEPQVEPSACEPSAEKGEPPFTNCGAGAPTPACLWPERRTRIRR